MATGIEPDRSLLNRGAALFGARPEEVLPLAWAFAYFFCLLCGYSILRPVRDEMAIEGGIKHLPWLMSATFVTMVLATPLFGWLSARFGPARTMAVAMAGFGFASAMCGLSNSLAMLVFFRSADW